MMKFAALLFVLFLIFGGISNVSAEEGHDSITTRVFRLNGIEFAVSLEPPYFMKDEAPEVTVSLADPSSGTPVYDAELYIRIGEEKSAEHVEHAGMTSALASAESAGLNFGGEAETGTVVDLSEFQKLIPKQMAGMYSVEYPLPEQGTYEFTVAAKSLNGKYFEEPVLYGGKLSYHEKSRAPLYRLLFVVGVILLTGMFAICTLSQRRSMGLRAGEKVNFLEIPSVGRFLKSAWFQPVFQIPALIVFLIIIAAGLFDTQQGDRNIATLLMWTIWWAAIIFTFVLVGRIWCMMCPFGAVQDWIGKLKSMNRNFPRPLRNIYLSSLIFLGLTWWDGFSGIVNRPALTAYLLIGFFIAASGMAVIFKGRSFCRYVCPIGGLIGIYSMFSPVELRNKCLETCRDHKTKECIKGTAKSRPCPMFVTPITLDRNNYCNFCSECIKSCSRDNIVIRFRSFGKDLWVSSRGYMDEALLAMALVGITIVVTGEMVEPWHKWMDILGGIMTFDKLGIVSHELQEKLTTSFALIFSSLVMAPLLLLISSVIVWKVTNPDPPLNIKRTFVQFAYMFIPVGISVHLAHNISHLFKEGPEIVPAVERLVSGGKVVAGGIGPLMGQETIFWLQMLVLAVMNIFALYAGYRIAVRFYGERALRAFIPMAVLAVLFMVINAYILGQPMALRHHH
jgi:polyferredoxin